MPKVPPQKPAANGNIALALDFGPLLVFFVTYQLAKRVYGAGGSLTATMLSTSAFMLAIGIAVFVSRWKLGRVSPMLWLSALLVLFFGGLTIWFQDQRFIQIKPTIIYCFFALLLLGGLARGKPLLKYLLQSAYDGLSDAGWRKLSLNWALFFIVLAIANEIMRQQLSFDAWLTIKVWGVTIASFVFAAANVPMLLKHGLVLDKGGAEEAAARGDPPQG